MTTAGPLLHWHLDELVENAGVPDSSGNRLNGAAEGDPKNVPDELFGSCLTLDGDADAVVLPAAAGPLPGVHTLELWVDADPPANDGRTLAVLPFAGPALVLRADGSLRHVLPDGTEASAAPAGTVLPGRWQHIAVTAGDDELTVHVGGEPVTRIPRPDKPVPGEDTPALIVGRGLSGTGHLAGRVAHVRVYGGVLTPEEIRLDMAEDEAELSAFVRTYPIGFELLNEDEHPVLFIDDAPGDHPMTVRLTNASRDEVVPTPSGGEAGPDNHHFALRFRAGVLSGGSVPRTETAGWSMSAGTDTIYLLLTGEQPPSIRPGGSLTVTLLGLNGDGGGGTRGTRVELAYRRLAYLGDPQELTGTRLQALELVNHRGRKELPLHVDFVDGDSVLSDGATANTLRLRIANTSRDVPVRLRGLDEATPAADGDGTGTDATTIVVSFEVQEANEVREWALVTGAAKDGAALGLPVPSSTWEAPARSFPGERVQWRLRPVTSTQLEPGGRLDLLLTGVIAPPSLGVANVYVDLVNLPDYVDGSFTATVRKAPLLFSQTSVGIGTRDPKARLHILDPGNISNNAGAGTLVLGPITGTNLRLGYHGDYTWIQGHGQRPLALNPLGNHVGIGTTTPSSRLTVLSGDAVQIDVRQGATGPANGAPTILFTREGGWRHRIEARADGFHLKTGEPGLDTLSGLSAARVTAAEVVTPALTIGGVTIGEAELRILKRLAAGTLTLKVFNPDRNEYLFSSDINDGAGRRSVYTSALSPTDPTIPHFRVWQLREVT
ncbi:LamG domain-containing protein [Streptomyces liangshanensis]|uniref:LamG domain-containing protein n=1 Tax=Streptomyces liangshanensis TaxID=2717324 RepID=A0A6G9H773_9ACTN|nr:LamG domain-containing protein [Streptomyces liangshanensis]QIQ06061.1 LamG domain-containing protein [Streptomyces liangshanensis]